MRIGIIGVGSMGKPMAANLMKAGFALVVHDLRCEAADDLLAQGAEWAASPRELAERVEVAITSLPGPAEVRAVMEGDRGLKAGLAPATTWIEMSTSSIEQIKRLAGDLAGRGVATLEAPVTGGVPAAQAGRVTMFVGGEEAEFARRRSVFAGIGDRPLYMGALGTGTVTKLMTNLLAFVHQAVIAEGLMLGARAGIDLWRLREAIQASYGASYVAERGLPLLFDGSYNPHFTLDLVCKDMGLVADLARDRDLPLEIGAFVAGLYERARERYGGDQGILSVARLVEDAAGTPLRA